ncbi:phospholipase [Aquamicrobium sp. LC103]|uniref:phospholipase n=1 Tax=Aquamicrobium sp. LC103 TaxID=1120658 RepID=UPI00063EA823|nr:phospholipase [Aquamicrobium sp. LC103]TKT76925.1 alpha/beta hydrolase [Aquamicrobium sp. LC103]
MRVGLLAALVLAFPATARAELLAPFKDELFAYPARLGEADGGAHVTVDYREMRDINGRDEIPERRAHRRYVDLSARRAQRDLLARAGGVQIPHFAVGKADGARFIMIYLHGQGGSRRQGVDDFTFGGNFNRIKNLAVRNGGLYLTTDFTDFGARGAGQVASLLALYAGKSPNAPLFVACGSMGGGLCWKLADDPSIAPKLGGLLLLGSHWDEGFLTSRAFKRKVPVFFGHGGADKVFPAQRQEAFFRSILARSPGYPARFVRFETGSHGTPIRMSDWRDTLNWMARNAPR